MDVRYKTFANRTSQDIRFDQLLRTKPLSSRAAANSFTGTYATKSLSPLGSRKRVNVVSFTPGTDGQELITKSPEKPPSEPSATASSSDPFNLDPTSQPRATPDFDNSTTTVLPVSLKRETVSNSSSKKVNASTSLSMQSERPQAKPPPTSKFDDKCGTSSSLSICGVGSTAKKSTSNVKPISTDVATSVGFTSVGGKNGKPTFTTVSSDRPLSTVTRVSRPSATPLTHTQSTQGIQAQPPKPFSLSRANTSPFLPTNCNTEEHSDSKRPLRTLLCGKNKRAAYNPRPWQQDIDAEDGSPNKLPKMTTTTWSESTNNRTTSLPSNTINRSNPLRPTNSSSLGVCDRPGWVRSGSNTNDSVPRTSVARNFDFPDSDSEGDAVEETVRRPQLLTAKSTVNNTRLPKLSRLIGAPSQETSDVAVTSLSTVSPTEQHSVSGTADCRRHEQSVASELEEEDEKDEEEEDEDDEEEDVKPWFRPASRDATDKRQGSQISTDVTTNRVRRAQKPLYTVVQKVKEAHVCQERGETQHLLDDVEYLVDGLADHNQTNTRALSVLTLANKCLIASFRYMVNAHGLIKRICANLHDAHKDYALALTSAGLFFILSRDRDPNVFDAESLPVMLKLLSAPDTMASTPSNGPSSCLFRTNKEAERVRARVRQLLDGLLQQQNNTRQSGSTPTNSGTSGTAVGGSGSPSDANGTQPSGVKRPVSRSLSANPSPASTLAPSTRLTGLVAGLNTRHLQMTRQLTAADLVVESILNLGTRKAADWFKAELRHGGGLDRVADAAADAVDYLADLDPDQEDDRGRRCRRPNSVWRSSANPTGLDSFALDKLRRVCHYTKLLENMTYMNSDNQTYLVRYRDRLLVSRLLRCVRLCASHLPKHPVSTPTPTSLATSLQTGSADKTSTTKTSNNGTPSATQSPPNDQSILVDCVLGIFRFLVNVSHNEIASDRLGGCPSLLETILQCLLSLPERLPDNKRFDLLVLTLCLLVNLCEHCPENRTRLVHLDIPKRTIGRNRAETGASGGSSAAVSDEDDEDDDEEDEDDNQGGNSAKCRTRLTSALDELIQLFLTREEQARNHDFERDDDDDAARRRREQQASAESANEAVDQARFGRPTHIEEAGLKWRLIEDRKATGFAPVGGIMGRQRRRKHKRAHRVGRYNRNAMDDDDEITGLHRHGSEDDDEDEEEEGAGATSSDSEADDDDDDCDDDDDDESVGSGADVEFVADTQEEQERLAEQMSQAQRHMEDSVVAAYAALLLGCILQSSPRYADRIRSKLPDGQFRPLAIMLAKLLSFLSLTKGVGSSGSESILRIVRVLEAQDKPTNGESSITRQGAS